MKETGEDAVCTLECVHEDVCGRVSGAMTDIGEYTALAELYKCFADTTRVRILHALDISELCVCDIARVLGMTKSAVSHQLKLLRLADLVRYRREGQTVYYSLADEHVRTLLDMGLEHIREDGKR